jgi:tRNA (guanine-N7-)-methyltransferase
MSQTIDYRKYPLPRSRHHVSANQYVPLAQLKVELAYYPPVVQACAWSELYANGLAPEFIDIGCGLGKFLLETSLSYPQVNMLGLEVRKYAVDWIQSVIAGEHLPNVAALWYNVANGLRFIESASVERVFYFFPDPWFKRRHFSRRAFTPALLDECARVLKPDGTMYLMTDVPAVDEYHRHTLINHGVFVYEYCPHDAAGDEAWGLHVRTNQEEFCIKKRLPYVRMKCRKRSAR